MRRGESTWLLAVGIGAALGACRDPAFRCETDVNCAGLLDGACEPDGFCSEASDDCESGRAYAEHSGPLSGVCIDVPEGSSGEVAGSTGEERGSSTSGASGSGDTLGVGDSGTSEADSAGTTSDEEMSASTSSTSAETGREAGPCGAGTIVYENDFENEGPSDQDWTYLGQGMSELVVDNGIAIVSVEPSGGNTIAWVESSFELPTAGSFAFEAVQPPPEGQTGFLWIAITTEDLQLYLEYRPTILAAASGLAPMLQTEYEEPLDRDAHRHGRLRWNLDESAVTLEVSPDGSTWSVFHELDTENYDLSTMSVTVGGGLIGNDEFSGVAVAFDNLLVCEL